MVYFKTTDTKLNASVQNKQGGTLKCTYEDGSGSLKNSRLTLPAVQSSTSPQRRNTGWHFKQWILAKRGANSYPSGTPHDNGSNTLSVEVGVQDIDLAAVFERDSYTLTLDGEISASYQTVDPNDTSRRSPSLSRAAKASPVIRKLR